jgi:ERCC4-related helicase
LSTFTATTYAEDAAVTAVAVALPEERQRIRQLLEKFPKQVETKVEKLIHALGTLWRQDPEERVVVFATYLGSVEMLGEEIDKAESVVLFLQAVDAWKKSSLYNAYISAVIGALASRKKMVELKSVKEEIQIGEINALVKMENQLL